MISPVADVPIDFWLRNVTDFRSCRDTWAWQKITRLLLKTGVMIRLIIKNIFGLKKKKKQAESLGDCNVLTRDGHVNKNTRLFGSVAVAEFGAVHCTLSSFNLLRRRVQTQQFQLILVTLEITDMEVYFVINRLWSSIGIITVAWQQDF